MFDFSNRKTVLYIVIYTVLIFGSGVFIGKCSFVQSKGKQWNKHHTYQQKDKIKKLVEVLSLTSDQEIQLTAIVEKHKSSMKDMDNHVKDTFQQARDQKIFEINAILTPEQQEKFKELIEKYKKHRKGYRSSKIK